MSDESARRELRRISARFAGWTLDIVRRRLHAPDGATTDLPGTEFALLLEFLDRPQQVLTRDSLARVLPRRDPYASTRTLDVYVSRLRRRFSVGGRRKADRQRDTPALIATCRHEGYVLQAEAVFE